MKNYLAPFTFFISATIFVVAVLTLSFQNYSLETLKADAKLPGNGCGKCIIATNLDCVDAATGNIYAGYYIVPCN